MEAAGGGGAAAAGGGIALHDFMGRLGEQRVHFHAMRLRDSLFLWVGAAPALASLAVAMCSSRDSVPVAASLLGDPSDTASACLARRLVFCFSLKLQMVFCGRVRSSLFCPSDKSPRVQMNPQGSGDRKGPTGSGAPRGPQRRQP